MQPGEIVVASLGKGARIVRAVGETASRVSVALDAKRQARIPHDRILLTTGLVVGAEEEAEGFREQCHALSSDVELSEVWEVVLDEPAPMAWKASRSSTGALRRTPPTLWPCSSTWRRALTISYEEKTATHLGLVSPSPRSRPGAGARRRTQRPRRL